MLLRFADTSGRQRTLTDFYGQSRTVRVAAITTTVDLYGHLVPEASGRARDALDSAFRLARMCPQSAPAAP